MYPLLDKNFLLELDSRPTREVFAKFIALNIKEEPIEEVTGRVTQGSVSVDGSSAVRRTCSLSIVANELNIHDYYWGLNTKFQLYIGLKNNINPDYPDIIWFNQGIYLITSFNTSESVNSYTISIQGKDKMCLLNGDIGGVITAKSVDFGNIIDIKADGTQVKSSQKLEDIIRDVVHEYAGEPYYNIIINDLEDVGLELIEYKGKNPIYLIFNEVDEFQQMVRDKDEYKVIPEGTTGSKVPIDEYCSLLSVGEFGIESSKKYFIENGEKRYAYKVERGMAIGYKITDLTYAGDLIGNVGESITNAVLDKIKNMLGEFEYFYNLDGQFVFQRKKTYLNTAYTSIRPSKKEYEIVNNPSSIEGLYEYVDGKYIMAEKIEAGKVYYKVNYIETFVDNTEDTSIEYSFDNGILVTSFQNTPNLGNIKNDFSIWGMRKSVTGGDIPIHLRYAIDKKPEKYKKYNSDIIYASREKTDEDKENGTWVIVDWREIIYQMASDDLKYGRDEGFVARGITGYEKYYTDILGFWRQLYDPSNAPNYKIVGVNATSFSKKQDNLYYPKQQQPKPTGDNAVDKWEFQNDKIYYILNSNGSYSSKINLTKDEYDNNRTKYYLMTKVAEGDKYNAKIVYYELADSLYETNHWATQLYTNPENINFWFDFLDTGGEIEKYNVKNIGSRAKTENDDKVKAIYYREVPNIIFIDEEEITQDTRRDIKSLKPGYEVVNITADNTNLFSLSSQGKSAFTSLDNLLYNYTHCADSVTLNTLPIYYLEPNMRIRVNDVNSGINGEFIINRLNIPLTYNGTMSITANKVIDRLK